MSWTDDFVVAFDTYGGGSDYSTLFSYHGDDEHVVIPSMWTLSRRALFVTTRMCGLST